MMYLAKLNLEDNLISEIYSLYNTIVSNIETFTSHPNVKFTAVT